MKAIVFIPNGRLGLDDDEPPIDIAHIVAIPEPAQLYLQYSAFLRSDENPYGVNVLPLRPGHIPRDVYNHQSAEVELTPEEEAACLSFQLAKEPVIELGMDCCHRAFKILRP